MSPVISLTSIIRLVLTLLISGFFLGHASGQEPWELELDEVKKKLSIEYMTELTARRRLTTIFDNEQSPFYGVQIGHVNVGVGNLTFLKRDLVRLDLMPLVFGRVYDSRIEDTENFGPGWKLTVSESIRLQGSILTYVDASNSSYELVVEGGQILSQYPHLTGIEGGTVSASDLRINHLGLEKTFKRHGDSYLLRSVSDRAGNSIRISYKGNRIDRITSSSGRFVKIIRNAKKKIIGAKDDSGREVNFAYDSSGQLTSYNDSGGGTWRYSYNNAGQLTEIIDPRQVNTLGATYSNQRVSSIDIQHKSIKFQYVGSRTEVAKASGDSASFWSHQSGLTESAQDFGGQITSLTLNNDLEVKQLSYNGSIVADVRYDDRHRQVTIRRRSSGDDQVVSLRYGKDGLVEARQGDAVVAHYQYDKYGNVQNAFDEFGRREYKRKPSGAIKNLLVDDNSVEISTNAVGMLSRISRNGSPIATFKWNDQDRITSIDAYHDGSIDSMSYEYNSSGLRSQAKYYDTTTLSFDYDAVGNLTKMKGDLGGGERFEDTYNIGPKNSLDSVLAESGPDATFSYDDDGRAIKVVQGPRFADIEYDNLGRLVSLDRDGENFFTISYDPMDIDAVEEADVKTRNTYVSQPVSSSIFGSLNAIAYARPVGSTHGAVRFNSTMGRFILAKRPFAVPDSIDLASFKTRRLPISEDGIIATPLVFDKPSNSMFIPPEFFSVNCVVCTGWVGFADIEVYGSDLPTVAAVEETIPFTFTSDSFCLKISPRGVPREVKFVHIVQYGDGSGTLFHTLSDNAAYSHAYNSGGTYHVTDIVNCICNILFFDIAYHTVLIQSGSPPPQIRLALTFDDGPHETVNGLTTSVINTLNAKSVSLGKPVRSTFFVERERIDSTTGANILQSMISNGHEVAIHGVDQTHHELHQDTTDLSDKLGWMTTRIQSVASPATHVRPPGGWGGWSMGEIYSKSQLTSFYGQNALTRYVSQEATGGVNSWFGGAFSRTGSCMGCVSRPTFVGYVKTAIDQATSTFTPRRVLLMHDIRPDDAADLGGIIDEIEAYADSNGVIINYLPVEEL